MADDSLFSEFKNKTEYAMQLARLSYLRVLSVEEQNVCQMTLNNNWDRI
jgi:hypothetical protein